MVSASLLGQIGCDSMVPHVAGLVDDTASQQLKAAAQPAITVPNRFSYLRGSELAKCTRALGLGDFKRRVVDHQTHKSQVSPFRTCPVCDIDRLICPRYDTTTSRAIAGALLTWYRRSASGGWVSWPRDFDGAK